MDLTPEDKVGIDRGLVALRENRTRPWFEIRAEIAEAMERRYNRSLTVAIYAPEPVPLSQIMADLDV